VLVVKQALAAGWTAFSLIHRQRSRLVLLGLYGTNVRCGDPSACRLSPVLGIPTTRGFGPIASFLMECTAHISLHRETPFESGAPGFQGNNTSGKMLKRFSCAPMIAQFCPQPIHTHHLVVEIISQDLGNCFLECDIFTRIHLHA